jgi:carboxylate-amine ligase
VLTWLGELLLEPLRRGTVACVNAFGNGLADDKLVHAYVGEMVSFYLGEEPLVRSVHTYDPGEPAVREEVLERIGELVVKPRNGSGGAGVIVCPHASAEDVELAARLVGTKPEAFVVQDTIELSTHPTVVDGALEPRHVDLRPFVFSTPSGATVLAGGLTRVALGRGALVVNSSMNGGGKDTWMLT